MNEVRARRTGTRWQGSYRFGGYWWPLKSASGRLVTHATAEAARKAADAEGQRVNRMFKRA